MEGILGIFGIAVLVMEGVELFHSSSTNTLVAAGVACIVYIFYKFCDFSKKDPPEEEADPPKCKTESKHVWPFSQHMDDYIKEYLPEKYDDYNRQMQEIRRDHADELERFAASPEASSPSWTAISRAPYLKALDLWFNGTAWNGGGLFMDNKLVWLNTPAPGITVPYCARSGSGLDVSQDFPFETHFGGECPGVYCHRLVRDGWTAKHQAENSIVYEKPLAFGWALQKLFVSGHPDHAGYGCYWERHRIVNQERRLKVDGTGWRWADYDAPRNRILYAKNGILYALPVAEDFSAPVMLKNFNGMKFEAVKAPY